MTIVCQQMILMKYHALFVIFKKACADPEGGGQGVRTPPPLVNYKNKGSLAIPVRIPLKSQSYRSSIQYWAIVGPPEKCRCWPANSDIWILPPS